MASSVPKDQRRENRTKRRKDAHNIGVKVSTPDVPHTDDEGTQLTIYVGPVAATDAPINKARYTFNFESVHEVV